MPDGAEPHITARDLRDRRRASSAPRPSAALAIGAPPEWDWDAGLSDQDRVELTDLRDLTARLREQLERQDGELGRARSETRALRGGLRQLAGAGLWRRRRVIALLRAQGLLD
jgi:hypothetical protein